MTLFPKTGPWTEAEDAQLAEIYADLPNEHIASILRRPKGGVDKRASRLQLKKSARFRSQFGGRHDQSKKNAGTIVIKDRGRVVRVMPPPGAGWGPVLVHRSGV